MGVNKPFVITIVGAESSGKTTLAKQLAEYLNCVWVPEYAREYLNALDRPYQKQDLVKIAEKQLKRINEVIGQEKIVEDNESSELNKQWAMGNQQSAIGGGESVDVSSESSDSAAPDSLKGTTKVSAKINSKKSPDVSNEFSWKSHPLFAELLEGKKSKIPNLQSKIIVIDGGMLNIHLWTRIKFNETIPLVLDALEHDVTDLYLLCRPQKEWTPDPLREAPEILDRAWIFNQYLQELSQRQVPFEIISPR